MTTATVMSSCIKCGRQCADPEDEFCPECWHADSERANQDRLAKIAAGWTPDATGTIHPPIPITDLQPENSIRKKLDNCRACGKELHGRQREYCSQACVSKILGALSARSGDGRNRRGITQRGLCAKSPKHHRAVEFALVKEGRLYTGRNIAHFVRTHPDLFDPADVVWKPQFPAKTGSVSVYCVASKVLSKLSPYTKNPVLAWKGWRWANLSDGDISIQKEHIQ